MVQLSKDPLHLCLFRDGCGLVSRSIPVLIVVEVMMALSSGARFSRSGELLSSRKSENRQIHCPGPSSNS